MKNHISIRPIYRDTDAEGVVYYANYLGYFEQGRTEYIRDLGLSLKALKQKGIVFAVEHVDCSYNSPAFYDDELVIETEIEKITGARLIFLQKVIKDNRPLVTAHIILFALDIKTFRPMRIPQEVFDKINEQDKNTSA
ncbi:YbgC/FadM family acyl-CoA thioesterase [Candidatus Saganbacteria bacterium]|nr:YbgC/FadM family acyl-CoA thioesterase [Candidatus Saganbacteria bacterium]